jgi:ubiquinone/menaquinone biosynthesis C-methylase UbiE
MQASENGGEWERLYRKAGVIQLGREREVVDFVKLFRGRGVKRALDLGCGTGRYTVLMAKKCRAVAACDVSKTGLAITQKLLEKRGVENCILSLQSFSKLNYVDNSFDAILCNNVLQHGLKKDITAGAGEISRVLKKGGLLYIKTLSVNDAHFASGKKLEKNTFLGHDGVDNGVHHFFTKSELVRLFKNFRILKLYEKQSKAKREHFDTGFVYTHWVLLAEKRD